MKKIISLFKRNYDTDKLCRDEVVPGAEWVLAGEGTPTRKWDGTCCLIKDGALYKRYDAKHGKTPPDGFIPAQDADPVTGHWPGWLLVGEGREDIWHREAWGKIMRQARVLEGTYELVGPKINGNNDGFFEHKLVRHGVDVLNLATRTFESIKEFLEIHDLIEGIVFHHSDGRIVKIKRKDFGLKRGKPL